MSEPLPGATPAALLDPLAVASAIGGAGSPPPPPAATTAAASPAPDPEPGAVAPGTLDKRGVPYDPARHLPKMHSRHGGWMPRPQRGIPKRKPGVATTTVAPAESPAPSSSLPSGTCETPPGVAPIPAPQSGGAGPAIAAEPSPWSEKEHAAAASGGAAPAAPGAEAGDTAAATPSAAPADAEASADALAEVACNAVYTITGLFTGHMKEARPAAQEHAAIKKTVAAYIAARGWKMVGGFAVALTAGAYYIGVFQKEGSAAALRAWWERRKAARAKPAEASAPPVDIEPRAPRASAPAAAPMPAGDTAASNSFGL